MTKALTMMHYILIFAVLPTHYAISYIDQAQLMVDNQTLSRLNALEQSLQQIVYQVGKLEGLAASQKKQVSYQPSSNSEFMPLMYLLMKNKMNDKGREEEPITDCNKDGYEWVEAFGNCIKLHHDALTWAEARLKCIEEGADLVVLDTEAKNEALVQRLALFGNGDWFIGLTDKPTEGTFEWVNGELLANTFEDWASTDPDGAPGDGDCVQLDFQGTTRTGEWFDRDCSTAGKFVCESKMKTAERKTSYSYKYDGGHNEH